MIKTENKEIVINSDDLLECLYNDILPKNVVCDSDLHHELHDKYTQLKNVYGLIVNTESTLNMEDFDKFSLDDVDRTFELFASIVKEAKKRKGIDKRETYHCGRIDGKMVDDPDYTLRAWRAVVTYLLRQKEFLYE